MVDRARVAHCSEKMVLRGRVQSSRYYMQDSKGDSGEEVRIHRFYTSYCSSLPITDVSDHHTL